EPGGDAGGESLLARGLSPDHERDGNDECERTEQILDHADGRDRWLLPDPTLGERTPVTAVAVPAPPDPLLHESAECVGENVPRARGALVGAPPPVAQHEPRESSVVTADAPPPPERLELELGEQRDDDLAPIRRRPTGDARDRLPTRHAGEVVQETNVEHPVGNPPPERAAGLEDVLAAADACDRRVGKAHQQVTKEVGRP